MKSPSEEFYNLLILAEVAASLNENKPTALPGPHPGPDEEEEEDEEENEEEEEEEERRRSLTIMERKMENKYDMPYESRRSLTITERGMENNKYHMPYETRSSLTIAEREMENNKYHMAYESRRSLTIAERGMENNKYDMPYESKSSLTIAERKMENKKYHMPYESRRSRTIAKIKMVNQTYNMPYKRTRMPPSPGWIEAHLRVMGYKNRFVCSFSKKLTHSDVKYNLNRLLIPKEVGHNGLIPELGFEVKDTDQEGGALREGVRVLGLDRMGRQWALLWKWWSSNKAHSLIGQWMRLVTSNGLKAEVHTVHVSVFCYDENRDRRICFVILHDDSKGEDSRKKEEKKALLSCQIEEEQVEEVKP